MMTNATTALAAMTQAGTTNASPTVKAEQDEGNDHAATHERPVIAGRQSLTRLENQRGQRKGRGTCPERNDARPPE